MNELQLLIKANEFSNVFKKGTKLPQVDYIRDTLKVVDMNGLSGILKSIVRKAIDNNVYDDGTINGYTVESIDGTTFFGSYKKCCKNCLSTIVRGVKHFYHSGVVMSFIGDGVKLIIDFEMVNQKIDSSKKDEGEQNEILL